MSSDEEIIQVRKKNNSGHCLVDSDLSDDNEENAKAAILLSCENIENEENHVHEGKTKKKKKTRRLKTMASSSESDDDEKSEKVAISNLKLSSNLDVNDSQVNEDLPESLNMENKEKMSNKKSWYNNSDLFEDESSEEEDKPKKKSYYNNSEDLFAEESSPEETNVGKKNNYSDEECELADEINKKPSSPVQRKERKSKTKAQTEIQEIHKETQRMMREARVSIPYHRPKQHTLAEFIQRRKSTPVVSLHTSVEHLTTAWKVIEQREKEAENFYKSESSDDESQEQELKENVDSINIQEKSKDSTNIPENSSQISEKSIILGKCPESSNVMNCNDAKEDDLTQLDHEIDNSEKPFSQTVGDENTSATNSDVCTGNESMSICSKESYTKANDQQLHALEENIESNETVDINNLDSKNENSENNVHSHVGHENSQSGESENLENTLEAIKHEESKVKPAETSVSSDLETGNTEEFSLRMSESQSFEISPKPDEKGDGCERTATGMKKHMLQESNADSGHTIKSDEPSENSMEVDVPESLSYSRDVHCEENKSITTQKDNITQSENTLIDEINYEKLQTVRQYEDKEKEIINDNFDSSKIITGEVQKPTDADEIDSIEHRLKMKYNYDPKKIVTEVPKISGSHDDVIDLEDEVKRPAVDNLIQRFYTHLSYKKKPVKKKTPLELSIVSAETDTSGHVTGIKEETINVLVGDEEEEEDPALAKPGAKFARLKAHLQAEMGRQREVEWTKRQQEQRLYEEEIYEGEKDICDGEDDEDENEEGNEDDESEEEEDEEEDEEEIEEDDEPREKKNKIKSAFIDDEAEESDDDNCEERDDDSSDLFIERPTEKKVFLPRTKTADMFLSQELLKSSSSDEEELPSFQKPRSLDEKVEEVEGSSETSSICPSPAFRLTALEGKEGTNKYNWSTPTTPCKEFISPKRVTPVRAIAQLVDKSPLAGSQDLENLCSGQFSSQPLPESEDNNTQDFELFLTEDSQISQTQVTPMKTPSATQKTSPDGKEQMRTLLIDGDDDNLAATQAASKKVKKLNFSDDEDEADDTPPVQDDSEESEAEEEQPEVEAEDVAYDSEENEVVRTAGDFLDKEAELSEEEWESEDEDEQGLDTLEMEEADRENIDQKKLERQLGQIHMKQMMIEDKKEVRLLQEMLLEDGELHSEGRRQRLFRWSNNVFGEEDNKASIDSDEEKADEDEEEENWRRSRHEREQYLINHSKKVEKLELAIEEESDSQLLKLGHKALKRMNSSSQDIKTTPPAVDMLTSPNPKQPYKLLMKRGSFLTRGQQVLTRLAQMVATSSDAPINQPKNSRNFVFTSISPTKDKKEEVKPVQNNKRKMPVLPLPMAKKPCVKKPKTANKKSLFEALSKAQS